jgi:hypothetical protein
MANPLSNSLSITWYTSTYAVVNSYSESFDGISVTSSYSSLAAFGDFVYWIRVKTDDSGPDTSLFGVSLSNLTPVHLTSNLSSGMQIIDANAWSILMLDNDGSIYRVPLPSGRTIPLFVTMLPTNILGTATEDATGVYFFDGPGTLYHCDPINCNATRSNLASGQSPTGSIYQDASALYWANSTPPAVVRLAK